MLDDDNPHAPVPMERYGLAPHSLSQGLRRKRYDRIGWLGLRQAGAWTSK